MATGFISLITLYIYEVTVKLEIIKFKNIYKKDKINNWKKFVCKLEKYQYSYFDIRYFATL